MIRPIALSLLLTSLVVACAAPAGAPCPEVADAGAATIDAGAVLYEPMKPLAFLVGHWEGAGWMATGPGMRADFQETEQVEPELDGVVLTVEGRGASATDAGVPTIVHHAYGELSFDPAIMHFRFNAFLADGRSTQAEATFTDGVLEWGYRDTSGRVRYRIHLDDQSRWVEVGEFSPDDLHWFTTLEMTLTRAR
jgi:hypothetical protein